jgi:uncharacterized protein (UPF0332 family)
MAFPEDLAEQARHLARREPRRPKQASLRRAMSTAYYALFHLLIAESTLNWKRSNQRAQFGRIFEHGQMKKACEKKLREIDLLLRTKPDPSPDVMVLQQLRVVVAAFLRLQQQRHTADYDNSRQWARHEIILELANLDHAFASWKTIREEDPAQDFLITLLLRDR